MGSKATPLRRVVLMSQVTADRVDAIAERLGVSSKMASTWLIAQAAQSMVKSLDLVESPEMLAFLGQELTGEVDDERQE